MEKRDGTVFADAGISNIGGNSHILSARYDIDRTIITMMRKK